MGEAAGEDRPGSREKAPKIERRLAGCSGGVEAAAVGDGVGEARLPRWGEAATAGWDADMVGLGG